MSNYNQNQAQVAYPYPPAQAQPQAPAYSAPQPPAGYPVRDAQPADSAPAPGKTMSRGDGFWKGWSVFPYLIPLYLFV